MILEISLRHSSAHGRTTVSTNFPEDVAGAVQPGVREQVSGSWFAPASDPRGEGETENAVACAAT